MPNGSLAWSIYWVKIARRRNNAHARRYTYYLIVCPTGIVGPRRLLHHSSCHSLEVHEVVTLLEDRHSLDSFLSILLIGILLDLLLLNCVHIDLPQVLALVEKFLEGVWRMYGVISFGRIFACILQDDVLPTGMLFFEFRDIVGSTMNDDPTVFVVVVFSHFLASELLRFGLPLRLMVHLGESKAGCAREEWMARTTSTPKASE